LGAGGLFAAVHSRGLTSSRRGTRLVSARLAASAAFVSPEIVTTELCVACAKLTLLRIVTVMVLDPPASGLLAVVGLQVTDRLLYRA
jgi:hypothetical protein